MSYLAGIDQLPLACLQGRRCALLTNAGALAADGSRSVDALLRHGIDVSLLFSREHGLAATAADGADVADDVDGATGIPVISLYGQHKEVPEDAFARFDTMVVDLPDVGVRYYTYPDTLFTVMEACAAAGRPVVVLDRANPLGAVVEGPCLEEGFCSAVGRYGVPVRHGMTLGEYAMFAVRKCGLAQGVDLTVVKPVFQPAVAEPLFTDFGRQWRNPSPNLRSFEALCCYPGTCLFEGTNLSEGRGTDTPFMNVGAPFLDSKAVLEAVGRREFDGLALREIAFTPETNKYAGERCGGIFFEVTDVRRCRAFEPALRVLDAVRKLYPNDFSFRAEHFDRLLGSDRYRLGSESLSELLSRAEIQSEEFQQEKIDYIS
ncbi:MAG: DUF1343 domain-containing protein [Lentisphaeria bacterium]|nr:DUF1343 domain-containing protein [Lentisphaeria bacterium]